MRCLDTKKLSAMAPGQLLLKIGKCFIGTPYGEGTLEARGAEQLVVNLREFDCATLVENAVALGLCVKSKQKSFETFRKFLKKIRYRQGRIQGYASRLHYFSDWLRDNEKKGILREVTKDIGGRSLKKTITFMTAHPDLYPPLKHGVALRRMKRVERTISRRPSLFVAKKALRHLEGRMDEGDLVAITTNREGLDVQHVGLAARVRGRIHLLHASSTEGNVVLSRETLYRYLAKDKGCSGIRVARLL